MNCAIITDAATWLYFTCKQPVVAWDTANRAIGRGLRGGAGIQSRRYQAMLAGWWSRPHPVAGVSSSALWQQS